VASNGKKQDKQSYFAEESQTQTILGTSFKSRLANWHGWLNIILLLVVLEIAVLSIEQARWITPQPSLTLVLILAMLITWLLVRSRLPSAATNILALVLGIVVTVWQVYNLAPPPETASWWRITSMAAPSEETIYFAVFITFLIWVIGYVSTWFMLRRKNAWVAVSLGAVVILVNLSNLPEKNYIFFGGYFIAAMLLIAQTRLVRKHNLLQKHGASYAKRGLLYFMASLLCLGILAVSLSWIIPDIRVPQLETMLATKMLWKHDIEESRLNFFSAVPTKQPSSTSSTRRDLLFGEYWHQGNQVHFVVSSQHPSYWRLHVYDTYNSQGWTNYPTSKYMLEQEVPWGKAETLSDRSTITYMVTTNLKTDVILTAGGFISSDTPVLVHVSGGDVIAVTSLRLLRPEERYTATSSTSPAKPIDLSGAGEEYPHFIRDNYLQLPPEFPERIRELSENITKEAKSPNDKVLAIHNYLSQIPYEEEVQAPPQGVDGVEHFLFTQKSGFCLYFASAMAVMLRAVDVPSRLVVGYLPGEPSDDIGKYTLRDKHYHAWPQAYFPGHGWVDLEATPSTDIEVNIETPWVAGHILEDWEEWDAGSAWETLEAWGEPGEARIDVTSKNTYSIGQRSPVANVITWALLIIFGGIVLSLLLISPILALRSAFYRWLWCVDGSDSASVVYAKMCALSSIAKLGPKPQQTPLEYASKLTSEFPLKAEDIDNIIQTYVQSRYGRKGKLGLLKEGALFKSRCTVFLVILKRLGLFQKLSRRRR
jgi:transglutaminase-like putative cysteine protease